MKIAITNPMKPTDDAGKPVHAHAGSILGAGGRWYWFGENRRFEDWRFNGILCYSSPDLQSWRFEGTALAPSGEGKLSRNMVSYRPKVLYNDSTKKYVMFVTECDRDCRDGHLCFAQSDSPAGPYAYAGWRYGFGGRRIMDMSAFKDDDGQGYILYSANTDRTGHWIDKLSGDYLSIAAGVSRPSARDREAPCLLKSGGRYYLSFSECTGWSPNQSHFVTAPSLCGPWSAERDFGDRTTFNSQGACILTVPGTSGTAFVYVGDRWNYPGHGVGCDFDGSQYILLPITLDGDSMSIEYRDRWRLDLDAGTWSV